MAQGAGKGTAAGEAQQSGWVARGNGNGAAPEHDLVYVNDGAPGITRRRRGKGFSYYDPDGNLIQDPNLRKRLDSLAIPPAYRDVWICPRPDGHLQATGRDERGRKQYIYHPRWMELRERDKFEHLLEFAESLPGIRRRVGRDLGLEGLPPREGPRGGRQAPRNDPRQGGQQQLREGEQLLRPYDHPEEAR